MKATTTRTLNPLPFQDLEPHRFEDLVRQLAYDLRRWKSLEATGRSGSDEGLDIRAMEIVISEEAEDDEDSEVSAEPRVTGERLWIFQCKREKTLAPARLRKVVAESLASVAAAPHGFVLAVACDVSKKARDAFREEMVNRGIEEFAVWAKGELEDMLFQPKNDRLLFAYFGISLAARRRTLATAVRSVLARKKQLAGLLGDEDDRFGKLVLLRDPGDESYPRRPKDGEPRRRWIACRALSLKTPGHLLVLHRQFMAATTPDARKWDAILNYDVEEPSVESELAGMGAWAARAQKADERTPHSFWNEYIDDADRAWLKVYRFVPLDRVVAVDPLGDGHYPIPHVLVDFVEATGPFTDRQFAALERTGVDGSAIEVPPEDENRTTIFPHRLPGDEDPPPDGFDHAQPESVSLSGATDSKLGDLLTALARKSSPPTEETPERSRSESVELKMRPFREWRENVALPVLSVFVSRLRAAGHAARVVVRSVDANASEGEAQESIELRVQLHLGSHHRPSGRLRLELSEYRGWRVEVHPPRDESRNRYSPSAAPEAENIPMPKEKLEGEVIGVLERLRTRGY